MGIDVSVTLQALHCFRQDRGSDGSAPFIWPAMVWVNTTTANVIAMSLAPSQARVLLSHAMHDGDVASIPADLGILTRRFDDDLSKYKLIYTVVLWEKRDLSDDAISAGFNVYADALQSAVAANLLALGSSDPTTSQNAVKAVKDAVNQKVHDAIENRLTDPEKLEVEAGILVPDRAIDSSSTVLPTTAGQSFQIKFGNTPDNLSNNYSIDAVLALKTVTCEAELNAVNQDTVQVNQLKKQLAQMKTDMARAPASEKKQMQKDIDDFNKEQLNPANAKLAKDTKALEACRAALATHASQSSQL